MNISNQTKDFDLVGSLTFYESCFVQFCKLKKTIIALMSRTNGSKYDLNKTVNITHYMTNLTILPFLNCVSIGGFSVSFYILTILDFYILINLDRNN